MPVDSRHAEYKARVGQWERCRDAIEGQDAVKAQKTKYLPALSKRNPETYDAYIRRAMWYGAAGRTLEGLVGLVFRKDPKVENQPTAVDGILADLDLYGSNLTTFCRMALSEVMSVGRFGVLVDYNESERRAYLAAYPTESVINWAVAVVDGRPRLTRINLAETHENPDEKDPYEIKIRKRVRELRINESGQVESEVYQLDEGKSGKWVSQGEPRILLASEDPMPEIPFVAINRDTLWISPRKPPLLDLVDVNLSHYRNTADLENGRHFCGLPTYWRAGFSPEDEIVIGPNVVWQTQNNDAKAGVVEVGGQGLAVLEKALESKERLMAVLGARLLEEQKRSAEAAATVQIRQAGEQSTLAAMAVNVSDGIERALKIAAAWMGSEAPDLSVTLNTDYFPTQMTPQELAALVQAWQGGALSWETLHYNLQRGELARPGVTAEEERAAIEAEDAGAGLAEL